MDPGFDESRSRRHGLARCLQMAGLELRPDEYGPLLPIGQSRFCPIVEPSENSPRPAAAGSCTSPPGRPRSAGRYGVEQGVFGPGIADSNPDTAA